jgi:hypothetical protein
MLVKRLARMLVFFALATIVGCGGGGNKTQTASADILSGNWQITLMRHANSTPEIFTGFLQQTQNSLTGSLTLGAGCSGVGPVTGTLNNQNLQLEINEFGQDVSLTGTLPPGAPAPGKFISGQYSSLSGGCADFPSTGTWSAFQVSPIQGAFHGTFTSTSQATPLQVTGVLNQGPNIGLSNTTLSGTITAQAGNQFCSYLTTATITGYVSGTAVTMSLFGTDGSLITEIAAAVSPDASTMACSSLAPKSCFAFPAISSGCTGEVGSIQLSFP